MIFTFVVSTQQDRGKRVADSSTTVNAHNAIVNWHRRARKGDTLQLTHHSQTPTSDSSTSGPSPAESPASTSATCRRSQPLDTSFQNPSKSQYYDVSTSGLKRACSASLDPFLRLPVEASAEEKNLLQFYLVHGRRSAYGTTAQPIFCPALYAACRLMSGCDVYVYSHLCIAEAILCKLNGRRLSPRFYQRRAKTYRAMNDTLSTVGYPSLKSIQGFTTLITLEHITGQPMLLEKHVQAMAQAIDQLGILDDPGLRKGGRQRVYNFNLSFWFDHLLYSPLLVPDMPTLEKALSQFQCILERIKAWTSSILFETVTISPMEDTSNFAFPGDRFYILGRYLDAIMGECLPGDLDLANKDARYSQMSGSFHFTFALVMSQVIYNYSAVQSIDFLERANITIHQSADSHLKPIAKHIKYTNPVAASFLLGHIRSTSPMCPMQDEKEAELCKASLTIMRILPLLRKSARLRIAVMFRLCAFAASSRDGGVGNLLQDFDYKGLCTEVRCEWELQQIDRMS